MCRAVVGSRLGHCSLGHAWFLPRRARNHLCFVAFFISCPFCGLQSLRFLHGQWSKHTLLQASLLHEQQSSHTPPNACMRQIRNESHKCLGKEQRMVIIRLSVRIDCKLTQGSDSAGHHHNENVNNSGNTHALAVFMSSKCVARAGLLMVYASASF